MICPECGDEFHLDDCGGYNPPCPCGCGLCRSCHENVIGVFPVDLFQQALFLEDPVQLPFHLALAANQVGANPIANAAWAYEYAPFNCVATVIVRTTAAAAGVNMTAKVGPTEAVPRSPVQVGGTSGVIPSQLNTTPTTFVVPAGARISLLFDELLGVATVVDGVITLTPL